MKSSGNLDKKQSRQTGIMRKQNAAHGETASVQSGMPSWGQIQANPTALAPADVRGLQASAGNRAVQRMLSRPPTDAQRGEHQADEIAQRVSHPSAAPWSPGLPLQRSPARSSAGIPSHTANSEGKNTPITKPTITKPTIQRKAIRDEGGPVAPEVEQAIQRAGSGAPLHKNLRDRMGERMGQDFTGVRVHTDARADTLARTLEAKAFTTGSDIFFKQGEYNPGSQSGQQLVAHELTHVVQQGGATASGPTAIQRKSDKLPQKQDMRNLAKAGFKLFGTSLYGKILNAVDEYHTTTPDNDYLAQLNQLLKIHSLLVEWQVSHGIADTNTGSKNKGETARRDVLNTLRTAQLPAEVADVYQQAKTANVGVDVHLLMGLMDIMEGNRGLGATIEQDYAQALHGYTANQQDVTTAQGVLEGPGAALFGMVGGGSLESSVSSARGMNVDPSDGRMDSSIMDAPISPHDSDTLKKIKKERAKLRNLVPALQNISDVEIKSIGSYTDESGYREMNSMLRGGMNTVRGGSKNARKNNTKFRNEVSQSILMVTSALNRLPDWDGSTVYRGEDIAWAGGSIRQGATITLKAFTSTSANRTIASGMAGSKPDSALWEINGVQQQGKDISKLTVQAKGDFLGQTGGGATEDEVLLRPYTALRIDNMIDNQGNGGPRWIIQATAL